MHAIPDGVTRHILGEPLAEAIREAGLCLWRHHALGDTLWLGVVHADGRAAGVSVEDDTLRVGWVDAEDEDEAAAFVDAAPAWARPAIERAREVLGV